jgi:hypothetical protein
MMRAQFTQPPGVGSSALGSQGLMVAHREIEIVAAYSVGPAPVVVAPNVRYCAAAPAVQTLRVGLRGWRICCANVTPGSVPVLMSTPPHYNKLSGF